MKKIFIIAALLTLSFSSAALGYVFGGSNLGHGGYPEFSAYISSAGDSRIDIELYLDKAKKYIENCNNDVERIREARKDANQKANWAVDQYNRQQKGY